jgi:uncharacterized protein (DUF2267 family)
VSVLPTIAHAVQEAREWLKQVRDYCDLSDKQRAYNVFRVVLHQLHDRFPPEEAFDLAVQLPLIVRGIYFEGYHFLRAPNSLERGVRGGRGDQAAPPRISPELAARAVFSILAYQCGAGETNDVVDQLPTEIKSLWPEYSVRRDPNQAGQ